MKTDFNSEPGRLALSDLGRGEPAVVEAVEAPGPIGRRLLDLGFLPETPVTLRRRAPLGDPSVYEIRGSQLCLRRSEASQIRVRRIDAGAPVPEPST